MTDGPAAEVSGLDHVVWIVADMERSVAWYRDVLGLAVERYDEWLAGTAPFVSVRIDATTLIDLQVGERTGTNADHVALVVGPDADLAAIAGSDRLESLGPPRRLWGAQGWGQGIYLRDPDGNTVELRQYGEG